RRSERLLWKFHFCPELFQPQRVHAKGYRCRHSEGSDTAQCRSEPGSRAGESGIELQSQCGFAQGSDGPDAVDAANSAAIEFEEPVRSATERGCGRASPEAVAGDVWRGCQADPGGVQRRIGRCGTQPWNSAVCRDAKLRPADYKPLWR